MKFKWLFAVALAALAAGCQQSAVRDSGTHYVADAVNPYLESGELPGAISVLYKDGVQETACLGWADVDRKIPMSLDRTFMQCSQTKGFCGVTVAILLEEGKISLDDPVSKYLPEFETLKVGVKDKRAKHLCTTAQHGLPPTRYRSRNSTLKPRP